jgi:type IV pilus assembly protein PilY1
VRCWASGAARSLTIVRVSDGKILRTFRGKTADGPSTVTGPVTIAKFDSPITGTPVPYPSRPGEISDRVYVGDADGTLWRINLADPDSTKWTAHIAFDAYSFSTDVYDSGQPVGVPPVVAVDGIGNTIVLFATGDQEDFFTRVPAMMTRVWSITEKPQAYSTTVPFQIKANWVIPLAGAQRVTGPIALFDTVAYFATFTPSAANVCVDGNGSIWGVDYIQSVSKAAGPYPVARLAGGNTDGYKDEAAGTVVFGVSVTQKPSCYEMSGTINDWYGGHERITGSTAPAYQLVYQTGRGGTASEGAQTNTATQTLPPLSEMTRIDSWASITE